MARKIDFSKALSPEEQAYVADRPWLLADAKLRGEDIITDDEFVVDDDDADDPTGDDGASDATGDAGSDDDSSEEDGDDSDTDEDDDSTEEDEDADESEDGEGDEDEVAPYDEWDYAALKTEAGNRGLSKAGSKEQLIERLQEDDGSSPE